jgi:hypothetical protein
MLVEAGVKRVVMLRPGDFVQVGHPGRWVEVVAVDRSRDPLVAILLRGRGVPYLVPADADVGVAVEVMD